MKEARILIVEHERQKQRLMEQILGNACYSNVLGIDATKDAVKICQKIQPHLVLLGVPSGGPEQFALLHEIRRAFPQETRPLFLAYSDDSSRTTRRHALAIGADDFLATPLDHTEFLLRCGNLLRAKLLRQQLIERIAGLSARLQHFDPVRESQRGFFEPDSDLPWALP